MTGRHRPRSRRRLAWDVVCVWWYFTRERLGLVPWELIALWIAGVLWLLAYANFLKIT